MAHEFIIRWRLGTDRMIRGRLARSPRLLAAYLAFVNARPAVVRRRRLAALALLAWGVCATYIARDAALIQRLHRHVFLVAGLAALTACVLAARRRSLVRSEALRSWVAALPTSAAASRWESLGIETAPMLALACGCILTVSRIGLAIAGAVLLGTLVSYAVPAPKEVELAPGSRYVPHRRGRREPVPRGRLSALGWWPVRQMFASARPKAVSRAALPILVMLPVGVSADSAMLLIVGLAVAGAMVLLLSACVTVGARARRWLRPLPLSRRVLTLTLVTPVVTIVICAIAVEIWFARLLIGAGR